MPTIVSAPGTATVATLDDLQWWLSDPLLPTAAIPLKLTPGQLTQQSTDRQQVYAVIGRPDPVVLADSFGLPKLTLTLIFLTDTLYQKFEAMRATQHVFLLQGPHPTGQWYVRFLATKKDTTTLASLRGWSTSGTVVRTVQITAQAVAAPAS